LSARNLAAARRGQRGDDAVEDSIELLDRHYRVNSFAQESLERSRIEVIHFMVAHMTFNEGGRWPVTDPCSRDPVPPQYMFRAHVAFEPDTRKGLRVLGAQGALVQRHRRGVLIPRPSYIPWPRRITELACLPACLGNS